MKRSLLFILLSMFIAATAYAVPYEIDLTGYGLTVIPPAGTGVINVADSLTINSVGENYATINQSYTGGADVTKLDNGDTFTEFGFLGVVGRDGVPFVLVDGSSAVYNLYFEFKNLGGFITNYSGPDVFLGNVPGLSSSFDIIFTPGVGDILLWLDTDTDFTSGAYELAEFDVSSGRGLSPQFVLNGASGPFDINLSFVDVATGVWSIGGIDLIAAGIGANLDLFSMYTQELGATTKVLPTATNDGFTTEVSNAGFIFANVVPEPGTFLLLGFGLLSFSGLSRRKFMKK